MEFPPRARLRARVAGAVVVRGDLTSREVLMVLDRASGGWRLPQAALSPREYLAACAVRAVTGEAALGVRLGAPIDRAAKARAAQTVAWWQATPMSAEIAVPGAGIGEVAWMAAADASEAAPDGDSRRAIRHALGSTGTVPVLIVRHGKAMQRSNWGGRDQARPLDEHGRRQSRALTSLLAAYGVGRLASSTSTRCVKTLQPYAKSVQLEIEGWATLSEEQAESNLKAVGKLTSRLVAQTLASAVPLAICGHRPVLPAMLTALGIDPRPLKPGACVVVHLSPEGKPVAAEHHPPLV